jgi:hypothetical protein
VSSGFGSREIRTMNDRESHRRRTLLAALVGAVAGGLVVAVATRAIPRVMSRVMSDMMQNMMSQIGEDGCDPAEM